MKGLAGLAICPASAFLTITSCPQCPWLYQLLRKGYHGGERGGKLSMVSVKFLSPCQAFQLVCSWHTWVCGQNKGEPGPVTGIDVLVDIVDVLWRRGRLVLRHVASIFTHHVAFLTVLRHEQCNSHLQKKWGAGGSGASRRRVLDVCFTMQPSCVELETKIHICTVWPNYVRLKLGRTWAAACAWMRRQIHTRHNEKKLWVVKLCY